MARILSILLLLISGWLSLSPAQISGGIWRPIGPGRIQGFFSGGATGRATSIAVNPMNGEQVWLGTAQGGVWYSANGGVDWRPISDDEPALAIGGIAVGACSPTGCDKVYAGTGENAIRRDTYYGRGLLVGTLEGSEYTWEMRFGPVGADFVLGSINDVVLEPGTAGPAAHIWVTVSSGVTTSATESTLTAPEVSSGFGIYETSNEGLTWFKVSIPGSDGYKPTDLKLVPGPPHQLYAGFLDRGIFKSDDGGVTWCPLNPGIPVTGCTPAMGLPDPTTTVGRFDHVEIAVSGGLGSTVYATLGQCPDRLFANCIPHLYRSTTSGAMWTLQRPGTTGAATTSSDPLRGYSRYTHALAVSPTNPNTVVAGGIRLFRSTDGGVTFSPFDSVDPAIVAADPAYSARLHSDHRDFVFYPGNSARGYDSSDGGFAHVLVNDWTPRNRDLQITGFQSIAASSLSHRVIGGTQDNSAINWQGGRLWKDYRCCGDAGFTVIDRTNAMKLYAGNNYGQVKYSPDGGANWCTSMGGVFMSNIEPRAFYAPIVQGPSNTLYYGTNRLYRGSFDSTPCRGSNSPLSWTPISDRVTDPLDPSVQDEIWGGADVLTAIAESESGRIWIGYYSGKVFYSDAPCAGGGCWTDVSSGLPTRPVTRIAAHPTDPETALVAQTGFNSASDNLWRRVPDISGHIWIQSASGLPVGVPVNTVHYEPGFPNIMWLGLDGNLTRNTIFRSTDGGVNWVAHSNGLPNVPVYEIALEPVRGQAFAGTHGRGAFVLGVSQLLPWERWRDGSLRDLMIFGHHFEPGIGCTMDIMLMDGTPCSSSSSDARGAEISTDADGSLVTELQGSFMDSPAVWACLNGMCAGGVPLEQCDSAQNPIDTVQVSCGQNTVALEKLNGLSVLSDPPGTTLLLDGSGFQESRMTSGSFDLTAAMHSADGATASICTVQVPLMPGETDDEIVTRAHDLINASADCTGAAVEAILQVNEETGDEDVFPGATSLTMKATGMQGTQMINALHAGPGHATGVCFSIAELGVPMLSQLTGVELRFETGLNGAAGGTITIGEQSNLGACGVSVVNQGGEDAATIAASLATAFQTPGIPGPHPGCPSDVNPRDVVAVGDTLQLVFATGVKVCIDDPEVGFSLRSAGLDEVHPVAVFPTTQNVECTSPNGALVLLDGSASTDPDSTPGTNDDIVNFDWYEDVGGQGLQFLGSGSQLSVPLSLGIHAITLEVQDSTGRTSSVTGDVIVEDTVPPVLLTSVGPDTLWPPNHRLEDVAVNAGATDLCDTNPAIVLVSAASDEPDDAVGPDDGATTGDIREAQAGTADFLVSLRAERDRNANGRTYTLSYEAADVSGNIAGESVGTFVPLDLAGVVEPIMLSVDQSPAGTVVSWVDLSNTSLLFNVVRGLLSNVTETADAYELGALTCIEAASIDTDTVGFEDAPDPLPGAAFFYLVEFADQPGGYGTETALKPRLPGAGDCL